MDSPSTFLKNDFLIFLFGGEMIVCMPLLLNVETFMLGVSLIFMNANFTMLGKVFRDVSALVIYLTCYLYASTCNLSCVFMYGYVRCIVCVYKYVIYVCE